MIAALAGLVLLTRIGPDTNYFALIMPAFILIGLGAGLAFMPLLSIAMADVPTADAGLGSGVVNVSMQMASALGLAVLGTVAADHSRALAASGLATPLALSGGYRLAFLIAAVLVAMGTVVAVVLLRGGPAEPPDRDALRQIEIMNAGEPMAT
jgi:MFS family permease